MHLEIEYDKLTFSVRPVKPVSVPLPFTSTIADVSTSPEPVASMMSITFGRPSGVF